MVLNQFKSAIKENTKALAVVKDELAVIKKMLARMAAAQGAGVRVNITKSKA